MSTRAEIDGDELVVNGQKIWTSFAHIADYQELLVRTEPDGRSTSGITWVICDMHAPGMEIREIMTIDGAAGLLRGVLRRRPHPIEQCGR